MKVCYFGIYNPEYSRNKILISGLQQNDVEVIQCFSNKKGISKYFDLIKKHWKIRKNYDVMVVGYPGFQTVILAKFLTKKPIAFNAFVSMYDSLVFDRREVKPQTIKALYIWMLDKLSFTLSDAVIFDTQEHCNFIEKEFGISSKKLKKVFLGSDINIFYPTDVESRGEVFKVLFYGHYIPLQGIEYIIRAAKLLENNSDIQFEIVGGGKGKHSMISLANSLGLRNIVFIEEVPVSELSRIISSADMCLGIFGISEKTKRVIPNKVFDSIAMKKPVITADTPAIRELFSEIDLTLAELANPSSIADAVLWVKNNVNEAKEKATSAYDVFVNKATPQVVGRELKIIIESICTK